MYVLIPIIGLFIYKIYYSKNKWSFKKILFYGGLVFIFMLSVGVFRLGSVPNMDSLIYIFLAEPTYTWWSTATYLQHNNLLAINIPYSFISSFINFLPAPLFENKAEWILHLKDIKYFEAPLGATSVFISIHGNFGWYVGGFFMFFVGLFYSLIEFYSRNSNFFLAYYVSIASVLPFQFFRDGFTIINKQIFWNMLILPLILLGLVLIIKIILNKRA